MLQPLQSQGCGRVRSDEVVDEALRIDALCEEIHSPGLFDGVPAMGLMLGTLLIFSLWLPAPLLDLMHQAAGIIQGKP